MREKYHRVQIVNASAFARLLLRVCVCVYLRLGRLVLQIPPQVLGVMLVICGVLASTLPTTSLTLGGESIGFPCLLFTGGSVFLAVAIVLKEFALRGTARNEKGVSFDLFVVNCFGSAFQCLGMLALLPFTLAMVTNTPALQYVKSGVYNFLHAPYMPWLTFLYVICNILFNVSNCVEKYDSVWKLKTRLMAQALSNTGGKSVNIVRVLLFRLRFLRYLSLREHPQLLHCSPTCSPYR